MSNKETILITGATSGLGRLTAKKCIDLGHTVIITGRSQAGLDAAKKIILKDSPNSASSLHELIMDLKDLATVKKAVETLSTFNLPSLDVIENSQVDNKVEATVFINAIAPLYLSRLLIPYIEKSENPKKRIIFVGSSLHDNKNKGGGNSPAGRIPDSVDIKDLVGNSKDWDSMRYYKISKLAVVWSTYALASKYPHIPIFEFCPGFVPSTELARNSPFVLRTIMKYILPHFSFAVSEEESTDDYIYYITSDDIKTGTYYQKRKVSESSADARDQTKIDLFWDFANQIIDDIVSTL
ncbi:unnamed protein product [Mucor hiemalis]